jgi:rubredoxin
VSVTEETQSKAETQKWICETCGFVYDPEEGDPDGGITEGTPFEEIPDDWMCPVCGARKKDFRKMEPGEDIPEDVDA